MPTHILIVESISDSGVEWLRQQGALPILEYRGEAWEPVAATIEAIIVRGSVVDANLMDRLPALRVVGKHGVGFNTIDLKEASARGIKVTSTPGANGDAVAEHAAAFLTSLSRRIAAGDEVLRRGHYEERSRVRPTTTDITESRLGVVGVGRIGRRVAEIFHGGYQCAIGLYDPYLDSGSVGKLNPIVFDSVTDLIAWADNIVVAAPLTPATKGLIGAAELKLLGPQGLVVVVSRGGIVDESDLAEAVANGVILGAGLDVFEDEPPDPSNPLFRTPGVVVTPHMGGASPRSNENMARDVCRNVWSLLNGGDAPLVGQEAWAASD